MNDRSMNAPSRVKIDKGKVMFREGLMRFRCVLAPILVSLLMVSPASSQSRGGDPTNPLPEAPPPPYTFTLQNPVADVGQPWKPDGMVTLKADQTHDDYQCCTKSGQCNWIVGGKKFATTFVSTQIGGTMYSPDWAYEVTSQQAMLFPSAGNYGITLYFQCSHHNPKESIRSRSQTILILPATVRVGAPQGQPPPRTSQGSCPAGMIAQQVDDFTWCRHPRGWTRR
jgi:hypothetical protein